MSVAIDIGGTFTDIIFCEKNRSVFWSAKIPSNPNNPEIPFIDGLTRVLQLARKDISEVDVLIHGTTIVTNALLEGNLARVGLLVTQGFRDLLEIGRQQRPSLYDLTKDRMPPLIHRDCVKEIKERISSNKKIILPLDKKQAVTQIKTLKKQNLDVLAIALLFSFYNPKHEKILKKLAHKLFDKRFIFLSSQVSPEFREFERTSTTVIAAAVAPRVVNYLNAIQTKLKYQKRKQVNLRIMHSGGGTLSTYEAKKRPHTLIESGPAAGLLGAAHLAKTLNLSRVLAFDMGGTTAKAGMILNGKLQYSQEYEVGGEFHHGGRQKGSGYPVRTPMIDVVECGAGAGSIGWIDSGGHLKVGPQSAGAVPGPACYGKGGKNPTVTDAHLILGRLSADNFLGGEMPLYPKISERAIKRTICIPLDMHLEEAAAGILAIVNANMTRILRLISVARGYDPRNFTLIAYGGAGPLHATELAESMSISQVVIPLMPGLFSTLGLLYADMNIDFVKTVMIPLTRISSLNKILIRLNKQAEAWFENNNVTSKKRKISVSADLRYYHQNYELSLPFPGSILSKNDIQQIQTAFHEMHTKIYGYSAYVENIQVVNLRLRATKLQSKPRMPKLNFTGNLLDGNRIRTRPVWFKNKEFKCRVYERSMLPAGFTFNGPAVVQEKESTTLVGPNWNLQVDPLGNLRMLHCK
jgi:N-methylhydantoinase A